MTILLSLVAILVLARWGGLIFFAYACWHLLLGQWPQAVIAILGAIFMEFSRSVASWLDWNINGRRRWLQTRGARLRVFPDDASL